MALTFIYSQWIKNKKYSLKHFLIIYISLHIFHSNGGDNGKTRDHTEILSQLRHDMKDLAKILSRIGVT